MNFLVTGAGGFIGKHLVKELVARGYGVRAMDNLVNGDFEGISTIADCIEGDVRDLSCVRSAVDGVDGVFHLAGVKSVVESFECGDYYDQVNVLGTRNVVEAASRNGVKRVVFASSSSVYGEVQDVPVAEDKELMPMSPYAQSKVDAEDVGRKAACREDFSFVSLRLFNVYGPGVQRDCSYKGVVNHFMDAVQRGEVLQIYGDGNQMRDFVEVSDVVSAHIVAMEDKLMGYRVYNCCTGVGVRINDLVKRVAKAYGQECEVLYKEAVQADINVSVGDGSKLVNELGWSGLVDLNEGLKRLCACVV